MPIHDISLGVRVGMPIWPGDPPLKLERFSAIASGDEANVTQWASCVHIGTHVDAPAHFIDGGASVDQLSLKDLNGRAYVVHLPEAEILDRATLEQARIPQRTRRLLFKTKNSKLWTDGETRFHKDFVAIDASGAEWLVSKGVRLVGVDYLSVAPWGAAGPTHRILLEAGVVVVEGLNLSDVTQGRYTLHCLPIKLVGADGAPARAILVGV
ncbi:MAG: cyclase family protein [Anaerolineales bacterium]